MNTLSVCIIARNEEKNISKCLESIQNIADEIILVDTGSVDNTINIAKNFNAKIIEVPFENNFSLARNKAIENASKDWIFFIDCDEIIDTSQFYKFKEILDNNKLGFKLELVNIINNKPYSSNYLVRIIKNNSGFYYYGKFNEKLMNSLYKEAYIDEIEDTDLIVYNLGFDYGRDRLLDRCNRNIDILLSYNDEDKDFLYYYYLGNEYYLLKKYTLAINNYVHSFNLNDDLIINSYIAILIIKCYYHLKKFSKAIFIGESFLLKYNYFREIYLILSLSYKEIDEIDTSRDLFKTYLTLNKNELSWYFNTVPFNNKSLLFEFFGFSITSLKDKTNIYT